MSSHELFELKRRVEADAKRIEQLEQQINELKWFKDEIIAKQQREQQEREKLEQDKQQSIDVLQQQSKTFHVMMLEWNIWPNG